MKAVQTSGRSLPVIEAARSENGLGSRGVRTYELQASFILGASILGEVMNGGEPTKTEQVPIERPVSALGQLAPDPSHSPAANNLVRQCLAHIERALTFRFCAKKP